MDRMLVVVFDNLSKAQQGLGALVELDLDGSITVYAHAVVVRNSDGTTIVKAKCRARPVPAPGRDLTRSAHWSAGRCARCGHRRRMSAFLPVAPPT